MKQKINKFAIRRLRDEKNLSQDKIATILGITRVSYASKETGRNAFSPSELEKLSATLGVSKDELFETYETKISTNETIEELRATVEFLKQQIREKDEQIKLLFAQLSKFKAIELANDSLLNSVLNSGTIVRPLYTEKEVFAPMMVA